MPADPVRVRQQRRAVRILPITPEGRILLLQCVTPAAPEAPFWVTPGGGLEPGEDERVAAVRELWEETSIRLDPAALVGPLHEEVVEFAWAEYDIVQTQRYFRAEVPQTEVSFEHLEELEIPTTRGHRWWSLAELRSTSDRVLDNQLAVIIDVLTSLTSLTPWPPAVSRPSPSTAMRSS